MLPFKEIRRQLPAKIAELREGTPDAGKPVPIIPQTTLNYWALHGPIYSEVAPNNSLRKLYRRGHRDGKRVYRPNKLYSLEDSAKRWLEYLADLPDEFKDEDGADLIWLGYDEERQGKRVSAGACKKYKWAEATLRKWIKEECPAFWREPITTLIPRKKMIRGHVKFYLLKDELDRVAAFCRNPPKWDEKEWMTTGEVKKFAGRTGPQSLLRVAEPIGRDRKIKAKPDPLLGHLIKRQRWVIVNKPHGQQCRFQNIVLWWREDVMTVVKPKSNDELLPASKLVGYTPHEIKIFARRHKIETQQITLPRVGTDGIRITKHLVKSDWDFHKTKFVKRKHLPRAGDPNRVHINPKDGKPYWPAGDVIKMLGGIVLVGGFTGRIGGVVGEATKPASIRRMLQFWRVHCPYLGGPIGAYQPTRDEVELYHCKYDAWFYSEHDVEIIRCRMLGLPDPVPATASSDELLPLVKGLHVKHDALHSKADGIGHKVDALPNRIVVASKSKTVKMKRARGEHGATAEEITDDLKIFQNYESSGLKDTEYDVARGWEVGTTRAAVKRHRSRLRRGKFTVTQNRDTKSNPQESSEKS